MALATDVGKLPTFTFWVLESTYRRVLNRSRFSFVVLVHDRGRLLPVNPHVLLQVPALTETFAADVADVGTLT